MTDRFHSLDESIVRLVTNRMDPIAGIPADITLAMAITAWDNDLEASGWTKHQISVLNRAVQATLNQI